MARMSAELPAESVLVANGDAPDGLDDLHRPAIFQETPRQSRTPELWMKAREQAFAESLE